MSWVDAVWALRAARRPGVLVTVLAVRGHAPRAAGAKMVVAHDRTWGSIGGGNVEHAAISRARALLTTPAAGPLTFTRALSDKAPAEHGVQCCGGEMSVLLEVIPVRPAVAVFGMGHVGLETARILARHDIDLHVVDSRAGHLTPAALAPLADSEAAVHVHHAPVLPETILGELPTQTHLLVMTHDHAEDLAICDAALRAGQWASIGLIGSSAKWSRFRGALRGLGHRDVVIDAITCPIGDPRLGGKDPARIAVAVAMDVILRVPSPATTRVP